MKNFVILFTVCFGLLSCELENLDSDPTVTAQQEDLSQQIPIGLIDASNLQEANLLLADSVQKEWKTLEFTLANSTAMTDCRLDDEMIFNSNGTYQFSRGLKSCGGEDNRSRRTGLWEIDFDNNKLIFDKGTSMEYTSEVIGLNESELRLKGSYFNLEVRGRFQVK